MVLEAPTRDLLETVDCEAGKSLGSVTRGLSRSTSVNCW